MKSNEDIPELSLEAFKKYKSLKNEADSVDLSPQAFKAFKEKKLELSKEADEVDLSPKRFAEFKKSKTITASDETPVNKTTGAFLPAGVSLIEDKPSELKDEFAYNVTEPIRSKIADIASKASPTLETMDELFPITKGITTPLRMLGMNPDEVSKETEAAKFLVPKSVTIPPFGPSIPVGGTRQEFTLHTAEKEGEERYMDLPLFGKSHMPKTLTEEYMTWVDEWARYFASLPRDYAKKILPEKLYKYAAKPTIDMVESYVEPLWKYSRALHGTILELGEMAFTPEGVLTGLGLTKVLGALSKIKMGAGAVNVIKNKAPNLYMVLEKITKGINPTKNDIAGIKQEIDANAKLIESVKYMEDLRKESDLSYPEYAKNKEETALAEGLYKKEVEELPGLSKTQKAGMIKRNADEIRYMVEEEHPLAPKTDIAKTDIPEEVKIYKERYGEPVTQEYYAPEGYTGRGITRIDKNILLDIDSLLSDKRLRDTPIRDESKVEIEWIDKERKVSRTQPMRPADDWAKFKSNISEEKVKEPILVIVDNQGDIIVSDGTHRLAAAKAAGHKYIPAEVRYEGLSENKGLIHKDIPTEYKTPEAVPQHPKIENIESKVGSSDIYTNGILSPKGKFVDMETPHAKFLVDEDVPKFMHETGSIRTKVLSGESPQGNKIYAIDIYDTKPTPQQLTALAESTKGNTLYIDIIKQRQKVGTLPKKIYIDKVTYQNLKDAIDKEFGSDIQYMVNSTPAASWEVPEAGEITAGDLLKEPPKKWLHLGSKGGVTLKRSANARLITQKLKTQYEIGGVGKKTAAGQYDPTKGKITVKQAYSPGVDPHEVGHAIMKELYPNGDRDLVVWAEELKSLAYDKARPEDKLQEGFAEFSRYFFVNPKYAKYKAPRFYENFVSRVEKNPALWDAFYKFQQNYHRFSELDAVGRVESLITPKPNTMSRIGEFINNMRDDAKPTFSEIGENLVYYFFDDLNYAQRLSKELGVTDFKSNPYIYLKLFGKGKGGRIRAALDTGLYDENFNRYQSGLHQILLPVKDKFKDPTTGKVYNGIGKKGDFWTYAVIRRAIEKQTQLDAKGKGISAIGIPLRKLVEARNMLDNPMYRNTFDELVKWQRARDWQTMVKDIQNLTPEDALSMFGQNKDYIPLFRIMDENIKALKAGGRYGVKLKKFKGSGRDIVHPYESIVKQTADQITKADQARALRLLSTEVRKNPLMTMYFEEVTNKYKREIQDFTDIKGQISRRLKEKGVSEKVLNEIENIDDLTHEYISQYIGKDETVLFEDGVPHVWKFKDKKIQESFMGSTPKEASLIVKYFLRPLAKSLRLGATVLNPDFMVRNLFRDITTRYINTESNIKNFIPDTFRAFLKTHRQGELWDLYQASGAPLAGFVGADMNTLKWEMSKWNSGKLWYVKHPIEALKALNSYIEDMTRFTEFAGVYNKYMARGKGKVESTLRASNASRESTLDFLTSGKSAREWNEITAFFTAGIQGWTKMAKMFKNYPIKTMIRGTHLSLLTIGLWYLNKDNKFWQNMDERRKTGFFQIPVKGSDTFISLPKPPGWTSIFITPFEQGLNAMYKKDPTKVMDLVEPIFWDLAIGAFPNAFQDLIGWYSGYDYFRGLPFVPERYKRLPAYQQYTPFTSETAKFLGKVTDKLPRSLKALKISPMSLEGKLRTAVGGTGRTLLDIGDIVGRGLSAIGATPEGTFEKLPSNNIPILRSFTSKPTYINNKLMEDFYDKKNEIEEAKLGINNLLKQKKLKEYAREKERYKELLKARPQFNFVHKLVTALKDEFIKVERDNSLSDEEKAYKLEKLGDRINNNVRNIMSKFD